MIASLILLSAIHQPSVSREFSPADASAGRPILLFLKKSLGFANWKSGLILQIEYSDNLSPTFRLSPFLAERSSSNSVRWSVSGRPTRAGEIEVTRQGRSPLAWRSRATSE